MSETEPCVRCGKDVPIADVKWVVVDEAGIDP